MRSVGRNSWSVSFTGANLLLVHVLAVRTTAGIPVHDTFFPEPLLPKPPPMRIPPSLAARTAAAQQWAAWWRIVWAQNVAQHREEPVQPEPPLFGLDLMYSLDPPKFASLTPAPELRQIVASSWEVLSEWTQQFSDSVVGSDIWPHDPQDLIARAGAKAGRPIADVVVHLEVLPVVGTQTWVLTEDPNRHFLHVIVTPAVAADLRLRDDWLLDALIRIG